MTELILSCNKRAYLSIKCHSTYSTETVPLVLISTVKRTQALVVPTTWTALWKDSSGGQFFFNVAYVLRDL